MYVAAIQHFNYSEQASKKHNLYIMFLIHSWPWNKVKVIKLDMNL